MNSTDGKEPLQRKVFNETVAANPSSSASLAAHHHGSSSRPVKAFFGLGLYVSRSGFFAVREVAGDFDFDNRESLHEQGTLAATTSKGSVRIGCRPCASTCTAATADTARRQPTARREQSEGAVGALHGARRRRTVSAYHETRTATR